MNAILRIAAVASAPLGHSPSVAAGAMDVHFPGRGESLAVRDAVRDPERLYRTLAGWPLDTVPNESKGGTAGQARGRESCYLANSASLDHRERKGDPAWQMLST